MVFLLDYDKSPIAMISEGHASRLMKDSKVAVLKRFPYTLIWTAKEKCKIPRKEYELKIDPGYACTGMAILERFCNDFHLKFALEIEHRTDISMKMLSRSQLRRSRRNRKTRYRPARWMNRRRPKGWLGPSTTSTLNQIMTWVRRLAKLCNLSVVKSEANCFDVQAMRNPKIAGKGYQEGPLKEYKGVRDYLLSQPDAKCYYCGKKSSSYEIDHVTARSKGGSDSLYNRVLSCHECNQKKGNQGVNTFKPELAISNDKNFRSAARMNVICRRMHSALKLIGLKHIEYDATITASNRGRLFPSINKKDDNRHWLDAALVGPTNSLCVNLDNILVAKAIGYGNRQMQRTDKYGFPAKNKDGSTIKARTTMKTFCGFQRGDIVRGYNKNNPSITGRIIGCEMVGKGAALRVAGNDGSKAKIGNKNLKILQSFDGYSYSSKRLTRDQLFATRNER